MIGRIHIKHAIKHATGRMAVAQQTLTGVSATNQACILAYHRIADIDFVDSSVDDWNVRPHMFEQQIRAASEFGQIIPLADLPAKLSSKQPPQRPWVCLTFDDGFANFYLNAVPILKRYNAHATLFVATSQVDAVHPMPFDRWGNQYARQMSAETWRPVTWDELQGCLDSTVVSIGSHSHQHRNALECSAEQLNEEAERSRDILISKLGKESARLYAYPYGSTRLGQVNDAYVASVKRAGYELAVSTDLGMAKGSSDRFAMPRVEAHPLDNPAIIRAKMNGSLSPYLFTDRLRKSRRR
ncbi:polysaccharide deacetylase family protein [Novipirellula sp. SH528]|uniref:polysaccharide deacetylase family protein n=1 Tax=Novipirellula sp. SH528 TaxID=3454466 RepID=UPI003FA06AA4